MNIESVRTTLEQASLLSLGIGFLLGFVFTFNPVSLAAIPVSLAYVTGARGNDCDLVRRHVHSRHADHADRVGTTRRLRRPMGRRYHRSKMRAAARARADPARSHMARVGSASTAQLILQGQTGRQRLGPPRPSLENS